jgi:ABC-type transport system involved in cytochrome bd biosynthesis fused ATPase/permease subunit
VSVGGVGVDRMSRKGLARHVGWTAETTHVFAASLADNLRVADPGADDAALIEAIRRAGLAAWLTSLPDRLATVLGAGGRQMSAGERQRLGLARALLAGGEVLALDEPTAHIDPASSADVLAELVGAAGERAVLVVSHEPDLGRLVDEIVTLDAGRVVTPPGFGGAGAPEQPPAPGARPA